MEAQVRTRTRGGRWSRWAHLHVAGDHGPDAGRAALGTDPVWTGAADELQLRLRGHARGLEARFVRAAPAVPRTRPARRRAAAAAPAPPPAIIPRSAWGGDALELRGETVLRPGAARLRPPHGQRERLRAGGLRRHRARDRAYHIDHNGWNDLGYNFVVDRYGQVFEGRAGGVDLAIVGAQAQGYNSVSTGVACLGTFTDEAWTEEGMEALAHLIGWKLSLHAVPVAGEVTVTSAGGEANRYPAGTPVTFQRISGHRDGNTTECPGDVLYGQLEDLRARAARYATAAAGLTIRASSTTVRGDALATLSGSLRFADGSSPAGATVQILYSTGGGAGAVRRLGHLRGGRALERRPRHPRERHRPGALRRRRRAPGARLPAARHHRQARAPRRGLEDPPAARAQAQGPRADRAGGRRGHAEVGAQGGQPLPEGPHAHARRHRRPLQGDAAPDARVALPRDGEGAGRTAAHLRARPLAVGPSQVVQLVEAGDRGLVAEGAVWAAMVVGPEPAVKGCGAFSA